MIAMATIATSLRVTALTPRRRRRAVVAAARGRAVRAARAYGASLSLVPDRDCGDHTAGSSVRLELFEVAVVVEPLELLVRILAALVAVLAAVAGSAEQLDVVG
jgi:hypothetical protein